MNATNSSNGLDIPTWKAVLDIIAVFFAGILSTIATFRFKAAETKAKSAEGDKTQAEAEKLKREGRTAEETPFLESYKNLTDSNEKNWLKTQEYLMEQNKELANQLAQSQQKSLELSQDRITQDAKDQVKREASLQQLEASRDELHKALMATADANKLVASEQSKNQDLVKRMTEEEIHHRQRLEEEILAKNKALSYVELLTEQNKALKAEVIMLRERLERMREKTDVKNTTSG